MSIPYYLNDLPELTLYFLQACRPHTHKTNGQSIISRNTDCISTSDELCGLHGPYYVYYTLGTNRTHLHSLLHKMLSGAIFASWSIPNDLSTDRYCRRLRSWASHAMQTSNRPTCSCRHRVTRWFASSEVGIAIVSSCWPSQHALTP